MSTLGVDAPSRIVIAHLGSGASLVAVKNGRAIDTTMGLTPAGGILMGTRTGDLDPGVISYLLRQGSDAATFDRLVNRESGLLGVSATSPDMRTLLEARAADPRAAQAVALFVYSLQKHLGALTAALGGLDTLVFTAGIGERASAVRREACAALSHLGVMLDDALNDAHARTISSPASRVTVHVIPTDEDAVILRHTHALLAP